MERTPPKFDETLTRRATDRGLRAVARAVQLAEKFATDPDRENRRRRQLCMPCHYITDILAGQSFTNQPCACCKTMQTFANTHTDVLCEACAKTHGLCKTCAADIDLKKDRKDWSAPAPSSDAAGT